MNRALNCGRTLLIAGATLLAGCASVTGPSTVHVSIDMPGTTARQMDDDVAGDAARVLFCADGDVQKVTSVSTEGHAKIFVTSTTLVAPGGFLREVRQTMNDSADKLPKGAVVAQVDLLPAGAAIPSRPAGRVDRLRIDLDQNKLIAAGVSSADVCEAVARDLGMPAWPRGNESTLSLATQPTPDTIDKLASLRLRSKDGFVKLSDVATIRIVQVPDQVVENWP